MASIFVVSSYLQLSIQVVEGRSMLPTLVEGDITITQYVGPDLIEVGDVIVFYASPPERGRIVHRVIEKIVQDGEVYFRTQGDNWPFPDPHKVPSHRIIGKVVLVIPRIGLVRLYISPSAGILLVALFLFLSFLYDYLAWKKSKAAPQNFKRTNSEKLNE
jgi:signal peptidase